MSVGCNALFGLCDRKLGGSVVDCDVVNPAVQNESSMLDIHTQAFRAAPVSVPARVADAEVLDRHGS